MNNIDKNEFFRQATIRICGTLDIEASLQNCLDLFNDFIPITIMYLHLFEPSLCAIKSIGHATNSKTEEIFPLIPIPEEVRDRFISNWAKQKEVIIINKPEEEPIASSLIKFTPIKNSSLMILPLKLDGKRFGALTMYTDGWDRYEQHHADLLAMLNEPLAIAMANALKHREVIRYKDMLEDDNQYLHQELFRISGDEIIGAETGLKSVMEMVRQVSHLNSPVLLMGETGVGKEVIANAIHYSSHRKDGPFIKVNCGAIPENLIDSELFGHEEGAFTGAVKQKRGRFERANKGTIFLDEIGDLPLHAQVRLLRVIQTNEIERVGGIAPVKVDIRIISATHRNLEEMVKGDRFREDLWYRLNVFPIMIPPLRRRKEDIIALTNYFLERKSTEIKIQTMPRIFPEALTRLKSYDFPGNVRELENIVERALIQSQGSGNDSPLTFEFSDQATKAGNTSLPPFDYKDIPTLDEISAVYIRQVLKMTEGKIEGNNGAAQHLNIHHSTLRSRMKKLGIQRMEKR